jgi:hypothetical protein
MAPVLRCGFTDLQRHATTFTYLLLDFFFSSPPAKRGERLGERGFDDRRDIEDVVLSCDILLTPLSWGRGENSE